MRTLPLVALALVCCAPRAPNLDSPGTTIVCFGDSLTAGIGRGDGPSYPEILAEELGEEVINLGVSGDTTGQALHRVDTIFEHDPWLVVVGLGGNDLLHQISATSAEKSLVEIVNRIEHYGAVPVLIEVRSPFTGGYEDIFDRFEKQGIPVVRDVVAEILSDHGLKSDRIHPTADGYRRLAEAVIAAVGPLQKRRTGA